MGTAEMTSPLIPPLADNFENFIRGLVNEKNFA